MELDLKGRRVVVTGAGSGIGKATALAFAQEGARLCLLGRREDKLEETFSQLQEVHDGHRFDSVDLFDAHAVGDFITELQEQWGGCDILVNNACSPGTLKKVHELDVGHWDEFVSGNLRGLFLLCRAFLPVMKIGAWGRIVNVGSLSSELGSSHYAEYATVKAAMVGLTRNLAVDYSRFGITVNAIQPGFISTESFEASAPMKLKEVYKKSTAIKRIGKPEEVADLILFLSSSRSSYITGAVIPIGGGAGLSNIW